MNSNSAKTKRWTRTAPESARNPKGSVDHLRQAVEALGPFINNTHEEAESGRAQIASGMRLSRQFAAERVVALAFDYNGHRHQIAHAPRTKQVIQQISEFERLSGELARCWGSMDDLTRYCLDTTGTGIPDAPSFLNLDGAVEHSKISRGGAAAEVQNDTGEFLDALSCYATFTLKNFLERKGISDIDQADKGGNTNLIKEMAGTPEWGLASGGWHVYEMFKPGEATGTDGGPFHSFLMKVFEFATGEDPESSRLLPSIKDILQARRKYMELGARQQALADELDALEDEKGRWLNEDRADEIGKEQLLIHGQRLRLVAWFDPPNSRKPIG